MIDIMVIGERKNDKEASIDLFFMCKKSEQKNVKRNRKCQKYTLIFLKKMTSKKIIENEKCKKSKKQI